MTDSNSLSSGGRPVVAITGAGGYLGSILAAAFDAAGFAVRRLVRAPAEGSTDTFFELGSVGPTGQLCGVDVLVHCAYDMTLHKRIDIWQTNVFGAVALFDRAVADGVPRTIALSSMSAYPGTRQLYGRAKLDMEQSALARSMIVVRPGLAYGPRWGGMAATLRRLSVLPVLPDFGPKARQFTVWEDDLAAAIVALALTEHPPEHPVGIAHPEAVPFTTLLTSFAASQGRARPRFVPTPPMLAFRALQVAELSSLPLPVRADSLLGLIRPASEVPNLRVVDELGLTLRPFSLSLSGGRPAGP